MHMTRKSRVSAIPEKPTGRGKQLERSRVGPKLPLTEPAMSIVQLDLLDLLATSGKPSRRKARQPRCVKTGSGMGSRGILKRPRKAEERLLPPP